MVTELAPERETLRHLARTADPRGRLQPPAYAPELNLIERLWRYRKDKLACQRWWNDLERPQQATKLLLDGSSSTSMPPRDQHSS